MARSGSKSITVGTGMTLKFSWELDSQSIANNTSKVDWKMQLIAASSSHIVSSASKSWSVTVAGKSYSGTNTVGISKGATRTLASGSTTITHNTDGTKSFNYSFSQTFNITYGGVSVKAKSGSSSGTLPPIDRKSSISATNAYIENQSTISITRANSDFKHTLQYKVGSGSYTTIVSKTTSASYKWTLPVSLYNSISDGKVTVTIKCITYSGSTNIGDAITTLTATAKAASTVSSTNASVGNKPTISISRNSSSFKHTLQYKISGQSSYTTIVTKTSSTSYASWAVPTSTYDYISSTEKAVSVTIKCITYYGDVNLGSDTTTFTASCNEADCKPILSPTVIDTNDISTKITGDANKLIKGFNKMNCTFNIRLKYDATIKSQKVTCGSLSRTSDGTLTHCTSGTFTFTVTDSRGYTTTQTVTKTLINYVPLTCNLSAKAILDSSGTDTTTATVNYTISGNYNNAAIGATSNTLTVEYRWKTNSGSYSNWTKVNATITNNTYKFDDSITGLNYENSYTIQARAYDALYKNGATEKLVTTKEIVVKAKPVFDWSGEDFNFNVPVKFNGREYGAKVLYTGGIYLNGEQKAPFSNYNAKLSEQPNGVVLVWSSFDYHDSDGDGIKTTINDNFIFQFIPKTIVSYKNPEGGEGVGVIFTDAYYGINKYMTVYDTYIAGNNQNGTYGTLNGISYKNQYFVLRAVIGV